MSKLLSAVKGVINKKEKSYIASMGILRFNHDDWGSFKAVCHDQRSIWNTLVEEHYKHVVAANGNVNEYKFLSNEEITELAEKAAKENEQFLSDAPEVHIATISDFRISLENLKKQGRLLDEETLTFRASTGLQILNVPVDGDKFREDSIDIGNFIKDVYVSWGTPLPPNVVSAYIYSHVGIPPSITVIGRV